MLQCAILIGGFPQMVNPKWPTNSDLTMGTSRLPIASDEGMAALIDGNGTATIVGNEYVYFFKTPG